MHGEPKTKEHLRIEPPAKRRDALRKTPPPIPASRAAHAGRERVEETPVILDPKLVVKMGRPKLTDSAEIPIVTVNTEMLMMETQELREFFRSAECIDKPDFGPGGFANRISFSQARSETERSARYMSIRTDDGNAWRLYPHIEALASVEKFAACRFSATLMLEGKSYQLYREAPERKQE